MPRLKDFLSPIDNFQYSVNLEFDLFDDKKIASYIPTGSALEAIEDVLLSTQPSATNRTRILTGSYGKGKSHLALALIAMLSGSDRKLFKNIFNKAKVVSEKTYYNINYFFDTKVKLLPVLLNTQSIDLNTTVLQGLSQALKRCGLDDIMPETFFDAAIAKIDVWKKDFPETYAAYEGQIDSMENTIIKLRNFDAAEYKHFVAIYPTLTAGSEFNPLQGADVIGIIESISKAIKIKGYNGLFFIYDEFSKFLDGHMEASSQQNIKLLQDIAERFSRSKEEQLHLLLISHKDIENYVGDLPKKIIDDWKGISKRFTSLNIESSDVEHFEMVAEVLQKDKVKFNEFKRIHSEKFTNIRKLFDSVETRNVKKRSAFNDVIKHIGIDFIEKCYPLHPYSLLLLPKIAELVAQNERTIFTFLASDEKHAVKKSIRIENNEFPLIEPDAVYDYFEPQFRNQPYGSEVRRVWSVASAAIGKLIQETDNLLAVKFIKAIALIYIVGKFDIIPPDFDIIEEMYSAHPEWERYKAKEILDQCRLLIKLEFRPHVKIRELSGNNADDLVLAEIAKIEDGFNVKKALSESLATQFLYPSRYNDCFEITRFFKIIFVDGDVLRGINNVNSYIEYDNSADGYVFAVITKKTEIGDDRKLIAREIERLGGSRIIYAVPKEAVDISKAIIKYTAIKNILRRGIKDKSLADSTIAELEYVSNDLIDKIRNYTDTCFFEPEHKKTEYYHEGEMQAVSRKTGLSSLLSNICEEVFSHTPKIINENINKQLLSAPMRATRRRILKGLLSPQLQPNLDLEGSQDMTVARSVFVVPQIIPNLSKPELNLKGIDYNFMNMFGRIREFLDRATTEDVSFEEIYAALKSPTSGIALRSGVIPFYIAASLRADKSNVVIRSKRREYELTPEILEDINDNPCGFSIKIENMDDAKMQYIAGVEKAVSDFVIEREKDNSTFNYLANALQKWFFSLSRFDRETNNFCNGEKLRPLSSFALGLKKILSSPSINAYELLFDKLPKLAGHIDADSKVSKQLQKEITQISQNSDNIIRMILAEVKNLFGVRKNISLSSVFADYYESLSERTRSQVFGGNAAGLLDVIRAKSVDEFGVIRRLIKNMASLRLEDLNDKLIETIMSAVEAAKEIIDDFNVRTVEYNEGNGYRIEFLKDDGSVEDRYITKSELPSSARTFSNEIEEVFDSYGEALTTSQKAQICLEVMRKLFK